MTRRLALGPTTACLASMLGLSQAIAAETTVAPVLVTAQRPGVTALTTSVLDTPQTITVIPQVEMREQGVATLQDALKSVPGVTLNAGEGGAHGDTINLRGFSASDDFFLDGLRDTGFYTRDAFNLEAGKEYVLKLNESKAGFFRFELRWTPAGQATSWTCRVRTVAVAPFISVEDGTWSGPAGKVTINTDRGKTFIELE